MSLSSNKAPGPHARSHAARCDCCGQWEVGLGGVLLRLEERELRGLLRAIRVALDAHCRGALAPPPGAVTLQPLTDPRLLLTFSVREWRDLERTLDSALDDSGSYRRFV